MYFPCENETDTDDAHDEQAICNYVLYCIKRKRKERLAVVDVIQRFSIGYAPRNDRNPR